MWPTPRATPPAVSGFRHQERGRGGGGVVEEDRGGESNAHWHPLVGGLAEPGCQPPLPGQPSLMHSSGSPGLPCHWLDGEALSVCGSSR